MIVVHIYVEGASDKYAMENLLKPLIERKQKENVYIRFHDSPEGDKKKSVLLKIPHKAVNILRNNSSAIVIALPDLYPKNKGFNHETVTELEQGICKVFSNKLKTAGIHYDEKIRERFKVFCFKYELESLILASKESLEKRLGVTSLKIEWRLPVEDQNHENPPKKIVEKLFKLQNMRYTETIDAPIILGSSHYQELTKSCRQCFKPFIDYLEQISQA
jgi:hypothetical protein